MTDSVQIWKPGFRILDDSGDPIAGGKIKFFDAGTSNPRTVHTDKGLSSNASTIITADSSGVPQVSSVDVVAYTNTSDYKVTITDASDNVVITIDNLAGALDTSNYLTTASPTNFPVQSKTSAYPVVAADLGNVINCDASGGAFTVTLLAAATAGDGATIVIKKTDSSANVVTVDADGTETIDGELVQNIVEQYDSIMIACDGSNWHIVSHAESTGTNDVLAVDATYRTISTVGVVDDTIPQSSEGDTVDTVVITPTSSSSQVLVTWNFFGEPSTNMDAVVSVFVDSETDASYGEVISLNTGDKAKISGHFVDTPATTSAVTYTLRMGVTTGTFDINGNTSARLMGGVATSTLIAQEF